MEYDPLGLKLSETLEVRTGPGREDYGWWDEESLCHDPHGQGRGRVSPPHTSVEGQPTQTCETVLRRPVDPPVEARREDPVLETIPLSRSERRGSFPDFGEP